MKKTLLLTLAFFLLCGPVGYAEVDHEFTDGKLNGRFVIEEGDSKTTYYIKGVMDSLTTTNLDLVGKIYPNMTVGDIIAAVQQFYQNNPTQRHRQVIDVILNGCK